MSTFACCLLGAAGVAATATLWAQAPGPRKASPALTLQVQLAAAGFSPGEIDGLDGINTAKALAAYLAVHKDPPDTGPASETDALDSYVITEADAAGPFITIPTDIMDKVTLEALGYTSLMEALGERFHSAPSLLENLNPGVSFVAGATITVPRVPATPADTGAGAINVVVSKSESSARVYDSEGALIFYAPVTSGSEHDPLPLGEWVVTAVLRNPTFNYDPALFWNADPTDATAVIPPGPNGPVGVVWIDLNKEHYGLHGSPEPGRIGHSDSHGCVRLTNWDASRLAGYVKAGTPVRFIE